MTTRKLDKKEWHAFFDGVTKMLEGKQAEIEVAALHLGDQIAATWLPLIGITYDPEDDIVEVALEGLDHLIAKPRAISRRGKERGHRCARDHRRRRRAANRQAARPAHASGSRPVAMSSRGAGLIVLALA